MCPGGWLLGAPLARASARSVAIEAVAVDLAAGEAAGEMGHIRHRRYIKGTPNQPQSVSLKLYQTSAYHFQTMCRKGDDS